MRATRYSRLGQALLLALSAVALAAAEGDEPSDPRQEDIRFDLFKADGEVYRFDRKTGEILKIVKTKDGFMAERQSIRIVGKLPPKGKPEAPRPVNETDETETAQPDSRPKKAAATIEFFDDQGNDITYQITDQEREASKAAIQTYREGLSLSHTLQMGERITGGILVRNIGGKKLKALELLLQVPTVGRDKPEEHRFLYVDRPGQPGPPQPATAGNDGNYVLQKVDLPCPPGGLNGSPDLKVSYLKFAD